MAWSFVIGSTGRYYHAYKFRQENVNCKVLIRLTGDLRLLTDNFKKVFMPLLW